MQTTRRPAERERQSLHGESEQSLSGSGISLLQVVLFSIVLGFYCFFVNALEGLDGDTFFLAVFCTTLTIFICQCISAALAARKENQ
jgi:hypothetical protein